MIYTLLKRMITTNNYQKDDMQNKLDIFFTVNRITKEQYLELTGLINPKPVTEVEEVEQTEPVEETKEEAETATATEK